MSADHSQKVTADHLRRDAFLYVRQSSLRQVLENTESTKRQYALRDRAVSMGWPIERVHVIDIDLGVSGASAQDRDGFQRLVSEVANGHAGIVLGLEVSRLQLIAGIDRRRRSGVGGGSETGRVTDAKLNYWLFGRTRRVVFGGCRRASSWRDGPIRKKRER